MREMDQSLMREMDQSLTRGKVESHVHSHAVHCNGGLEVLLLGQQRRSYA